MTSDRAVAEIGDLDQRLIGELSSGLVVDVARPDYETRLGILRRRAEERGAEFGEGVLEATARFEVPNVRELIGALNRLVALQAVSDAPISPEGAVSMLSDLQSAHGPAAAAPAGDFIIGDAALSEFTLPPAAMPAPPVAAAPTPPAAPPPAPPPASRPVADEFAQFLSGVESTVARQVEAWRARLGETILRWEGEGYQTTRLGSVLDRGDARQAEAAVRQFERDVERLRSFADEIAVLDPVVAGDAVFRDPDRLDEAAALVKRARDGVATPSGPSGAWAFGGFAVGESNRAAYDAALAVVEAPGTRHNPLVLVGPPGIGKTHLLHSVGHALAAGPGALVACLPAQDFLDELAQAAEGNRMDQWRSKYRRATAFLLDDLQLVAGVERAQGELFHLFGHMLGAGRQMGFSLTAPPRDVGLEPRLVARLEGGLVVRVERPDREVRAALIRRIITERLGSADADLVEYFTDRQADSMRVVQGMVQRVLRSAESEGTRPDRGFAQKVLEHVSGRPSHPGAGVRTSGVALTPAAVARSREKLVWDWPDPADRLIEEVG
jgi:chromosomal replication initiation ATPase DnaA